jgi:probable O-glycosylation ligase (exosortase A-associated)
LFVALTMLYPVILGQATYVTEGVERASGLGSFLRNPNDAAVALLAGLPLALFLWEGEQSHAHSGGREVFRRVLLTAAIASILAALVASGSRGGFLGLLAVAAVCWWRSRRKGLATVILVLTAVIAWSLAPAEYAERMGSILRSGSDVSAQGRIQGWRIATAIFWREPLTGVGGGNFAAARADWFPTGDPRTDWLDVHSLYFQALSELGVVGTLSLLALLGLVLREGAGCRRAWSVQAAFLGLMVAGAFTHLLFYPFLYTLAALTTAIRRVEREGAGDGG